jgi:hypothetical protein
MHLMTSKKGVKSTLRSTTRSEDVSSDEYMASRGFVEMTPRESRRYSRHFECADPHHAVGHIWSFWLRAKHLFR